MQLAAQLDAAIAFVQDEIKELQAGNKDSDILDLAETPGLPPSQFASLLDHIQVPPVPSHLQLLAKRLQSLRQPHTDKSPPSIDPQANPQEPVVDIKTDNEGQDSILSDRVKTLRQSMMLDVMSKIVQVAQSKGVDPTRFSDTPDLQSLHSIESDVKEGKLVDWQVFAKLIYSFCQGVITHSEQSELRQKGLELQTFARQLTETLHRACATKEANLSPSNAHPPDDPASPNVSSRLRQRESPGDSTPETIKTRKRARTNSTEEEEAPATRTRSRRPSRASTRQSTRDRQAKHESDEHTKAEEKLTKAGRPRKRPGRKPRKVE